MKVLIVYGSRMGGTAGLAKMLGEGLRRYGFWATVAEATRSTSPAGYDAVIVGGALYANRWHPQARRFVRRHAAALRQRPVWFFSSGPLDDSADRQRIDPTRQVEALMEQVGALGHVTFGGRLPPDAKGFPARVMAKKLVGDFRDPERVADWAAALALALPNAHKLLSHQPAPTDLGRIAVHGVSAWLFATGLRALAYALVGEGATTVLHAVFAPLVFGAAAAAYFSSPHPREPSFVAGAMTSLAGVLDLLLMFAFVGSLAPFASFAATWLPLALIFGFVWATGVIFTLVPRTPTKWSPGSR